jgi:hypothetical protein
VRYVRDELEARSMVNAKCELTNPLGCRDGKSRSGEMTGLAEGTGRA